MVSSVQVDYISKFQGKLMELFFSLAPLNSFLILHITLKYWSKPLRTKLLVSKIT